MNSFVRSLTIVILVISLHEGNCQNVYHASRAMDCSDENTNPDWKWYENNTVQLYVEPNSQPINRLMPWFDNNGTAAIALNTGNNETRDMYPRDGWVLIFRDFGTDQINQRWPHFILYNKFKGVLRLFFIDFFESTQKTMYAIKFYHKDNSINSANISSNSIGEGYLNTYDPTHSQIAITRATPTQWAYVDFDLTTYDPFLPHNLGYAFEVNSVLQGHIDLFANKLEEIDDKTPTVFDGINSAIQTSQAGFALGKKYFSTPQGFLKDMKKLANDNVGKWFENPLRTISNPTVANSIPVISGIVGVISGFIGADKGSSSSFTPFTITGEVEFESPIADFFIWAPGSTRSESDCRGRPLSDKPLGIIGFNQPTIGSLANGSAQRQMLVMEYFINPYSDIKVTKMKFGHLSHEENITYYSEEGFYHELINMRFNRYDPETIGIAINLKVQSVCYPETSAHIMKTFTNCKPKTDNWVFGSGANYNPPYGKLDLTWHNGVVGEKHYLGNFITGSDGGLLLDNCTGSYHAPTSIIFKPGTHITGGDMTFGVRYKALHEKHISQSFVCTDVSSNSGGRVANFTNGNSTENFTKSTVFQLYPNPFIRSIQVVPSNKSETYDIHVFDIYGKYILREVKVTGDFSLDFNSLDNGIYIVKIIDSEGSYTQSKVIKK